MEDYRNELNIAKNETASIKQGVSDEVIIEIVHGIKDILIELIDKAFDRDTADISPTSKR